MVAKVGSHTLRSRQIDALIRLLRTSASVGPNYRDGNEVGGSTEWRVFIYDTYCRDIISPVLKLGDLRREGVTLHLNVDDNRGAVPDVPAVYFVCPTQKNVEQIIRDMSNGLYEIFYLHFCKPLPQLLLRRLAEDLLKSGATQRLGKVYDQFLNYVCIEDNIFSLNSVGSYAQLNDTHTNEAEIEKLMEDIVDCLISVFVTLGKIPIIKAPRGGSAQEVATRLEAKFKNLLSEDARSSRSGYNLLGDGVTSSFGFARPVLILQDRNSDLVTPLRHVWTYQALVHDILNVKLNKISLAKDPSAGEGKAIIYDLDSSDSFWRDFGGAEFPRVAEEVEIQLGKYKADVNELNQKAHGFVPPGLQDPDPLGSDAASALTSAVSSLPELTERKRTIDKHTNIATALLREIKARQLDNFVGQEEGLIATGKWDKGQILSMLSSSQGTAEDKLRIVMLCHLTAGDSLSSSDVDSLENTLRLSGVDLAPLRYAQRMQKFQRAVGGRVNQKSESRSGAMDQMGKLVSDGFTKISTSLLANSTRPLIVKCVESLMDHKQTVETDGWITIDPRGRSDLADEGPSRDRNPFREAVVFMIGGGCYGECQALQDFASGSAASKDTLRIPSVGLGSNPRKILYGSSEMLNATNLISQMNSL